MYVISVDSLIFPYILATAVETPEDALAMCEQIARIGGRSFVDGVLDNAVKELKTHHQTRLFAFKPESIEKDFGFIIAEIATPVVSAPVTGQFHLEVDGDVVLTGTLGEVKAYIGGLCYTSNGYLEDDYLGISLDLDKTFAIPTNETEYYRLILRACDDERITSITVRWEALNG